MKNLLFRFGVFSVLFALSASAVHAQVVNCDAPGQDLQTRINATALGDRLDVMGVCDQGPYVIERHIKLVGSATLSATTGSVLIVRAASAVLRDITIFADGATVGLRAMDNGTILADNIVVSGATDEGIVLGQSSTLRIVSSTIKENRVGVGVVNGSTLTMSDTTVEYNTFGVTVSRSSAGAIFNSRINHNTITGVGVTWDGTVQISGTEITNNGNRGVGITLDSFVNFFNPPSTIQSNGVYDVTCEGRSGFFASVTQISLTMALNKTADCLDGFVAGFGAPLF